MPGCLPVLTNHRGLRWLLPVAAAILTACTASTSAAPEPAAPPTEAANAMYDDFDGPAGAPPNPRYWGYDLGSPGAANNEMQVYTNSPDNVRLDGQGHLVIQAQKAPNGYTSGRIVTRGKVDMMYGTLTARIKFPAGQGIWPAFWTLGSNMDSVGWPDSGEIDIMELVNSGSTYHVSLHGPQGNSDYLGGNGVGPSGPIADLTKDFHEYWLHWQPDNITDRRGRDHPGDIHPVVVAAGRTLGIQPPHVRGAQRRGGWQLAGPPDASTPFPATMLVDWVRYTP